MDEARALEFTLFRIGEVLGATVNKHKPRMSTLGRSDVLYEYFEANWANASWVCRIIIHISTRLYIH